MIEELEYALDVQEAYWYLSLSDGEITPASYLQTFANYVLSFFTDAHQKALSDRLIEVLQEVDRTSAKMQIVLEKIQALQGRIFWVGKTSLELLDLEPLLLVKEEVQPFPHQIMP